MNGFNFQLFREPIEVRELMVRVLPGKNNDSATVLLTINNSTTISELKIRLASSTEIEKDRMLLLFGGRKLSNNEIIPEDAYELMQQTKDDLQLFRPRICLYVIPLDEEVTDNIQERLRTPVVQEMQQIDDTVFSDIGSDDIGSHELKHEKFTRRRFNLLDELVAIDCSQFFDMLCKNGYNEEGVFSTLVDTDFQAENLWIPKRAATRLKALADAIKRRIEKEDLILMDRQKVTSPGDRKFSTGNEEEAFLTKTDVKRAWEKKEKLKKMATANLPVITEKVIEAKPHSEKLQEKIDSIRRSQEDRNNEKSDKKLFGLGTHDNNLDYPESDTKICCEKHSKMIFAGRKKYDFLRDHEVSFVSFLELKRLSVFNDYMIASEETLRCIAKEIADRFSLRCSDNDVDIALKKCFMSLVDQKRLVHWTQEKDIADESACGALPVDRYDVMRFVTELKQMIARMDNERF